MPDITDQIVETERLVLRPIDADKDFDAWAETMADEATMRFLGGKVMDRALAWRNMAMVMGHWQIRGYGFFSVIEKETGAWVGRIGPWNPEGWLQPEVGWTIHPAHTRKGYASEAGEAAIKYAFETLGWAEVVHVIEDGNVASIGVAEKLGSTCLRSVEGIPGVLDGLCWVYGQTAVR